jgi:cytochrome P450
VIDGAVDLTDLDLFTTGDPDAAFRHLRSHAPISWNPQADGPGFWVVVRHADVVRVLRDAAAFSVEKGMRLAVNRGRGDPAAGRMLVVTDPPRHDRLRAVVQHAFTTRSAARLEDHVRRLVDELLAPLPARCDFATDVAARLPVAVICGLLGVPRADGDRMLELTNAAFGSTDAEYRAGAPSPARAALLAHHDILAYFSDLLAARRRRPEDDLVSVLAEASVDGVRLTDEEVQLNCLNLLVGGNETTRHAAAGGLLALLQHPDQLRRLRADPALLPDAVEEVLRWTSPGLYALRTAKVDVDVAGTAVLAGQAVTVWMASANRDEAVFPDADRFDVGRRPNRHLTMGTGTHFCLGAAARPRRAAGPVRAPPRGRRRRRARRPGGATALEPDPRHQAPAGHDSAVASARSGRDCRRIFDAHAPHLAALLLRSSLTHPRMGSLRSSAPDHDLGHLAAESLAVIPGQTSPPPRPGRPPSSRPAGRAPGSRPPASPRRAPASGWP